MKNKALGMGKVLHLIPNPNPKPYPLIFDTLHIPAENEALQFWKVYFDFGFIFCFIPFRLRFNSETGNYEIFTHVVQKVNQP